MRAWLNSLKGEINAKRVAIEGMKKESGSVVGGNEGTAERKEERRKDK